MSTKITYNGKTTELADGYIATLPCKDQKMETDVVVEAPEAVEVPTVEEWDGTGVVIEGLVKLISFTVSGTEFQAEDGMTWSEWCDSDYNTHGAYIELGNGAMTVWWQTHTAPKFYAVSTTDSIVSENETIIADYAYTTTSVTHM